MKIIVACIVLILGIIVGWSVFRGIPREIQKEKPNTREKCLFQGAKIDYRHNLVLYQRVLSHHTVPFYHLLVGSEVRASIIAVFPQLLNG